MRKLLFSIMLLALFCASPARADIRVLASTFPIEQFTRNVCKDVPGVQVELLIPASAGCPHDFALKPADMRKLGGASILVINGAGLEEFLERFLQSAPATLAVIDASEGLELLDDPHHHKNPHVFASPAEAAKMVSHIAARLAELDPEHALLYLANGESYAASLNALSLRLREVGARAANRKVALEHDALAYFIINAGLAIEAFVQPDATAVQIAGVIRDFKANPPALFIGDTQYSDRLAVSLSKETGIPFVRLDSGASGPEDAAADYYLNVMEANISALEQKID